MGWDFIREGFCPSLKICGRDFIHLVKRSGGDFILVAKNMGGIISTYTKMTRGDSVREGFCPTFWKEHYERLLNVEFPWNPEDLSEESPVEGPSEPITLEMITIHKGHYQNGIWQSSRTIGYCR